jgi:hypothetical protein
VVAKPNQTRGGNCVRWGQSSRRKQLERERERDGIEQVSLVLVCFHDARVGADVRCWVLGVRI